MWFQSSHRKEACVWVLRKFIFSRCWMLQIALVFYILLSLSQTLISFLFYPSLRWFYHKRRNFKNLINCHLSERQHLADVSDSENCALGLRPQTVTTCKHMKTFLSSSFQGWSVCLFVCQFACFRTLKFLLVDILFRMNQILLTYLHVVELYILKKISMYCSPLRWNHLLPIS